MLVGCWLGLAIRCCTCLTHGTRALQRVVTQYENPFYGAPNYTDNGTYVRTTRVLPGLINPAAISAIPPISRDSGRSGGAVAQGGLVVADAGDTTLKVFDSNVL